MQMALTQFIRRNAQITRNSVATTFGERSQDWTGFQNRISRLAAGLQGLGVTPGDRVAILANNSDRYLEYFFAVPWSGGVFVPINTRLAPPEVEYWISDSGSQILFIDDDFLPYLPKLRGKMPSVQHLSLIHI